MRTGDGDGMEMASLGLRRSGSGGGCWEIALRNFGRLAGAGASSSA